MADTAFAPGQIVRVLHSSEFPDADIKYEGRVGIVLRYAPHPDLVPSIPWRVGFPDGDVAGFEAEELAPESSVTEPPARTPHLIEDLQRYGYPEASASQTDIEVGG